MQGIEKYFGKYENQSIKKLVEKFISDNWEENELSELLNVTIKQYSTQYKTQPDVAFFNKLWESNHSAEDEAEKAWNSLLKMRTFRSILCTDIVTQETLKSMGGIDDFVDYRDKSNQWCHKDFIERYIRYKSKDFLMNAKPEILLNGIERMYPTYPRDSFYMNLKIIGDQQKGMQLLEDIKTDKLQIENNSELKQIGDVMKDFTKTFSEI
jgi:hypothetical protein